jgi:ABC-type antimicrobial peptide transport system permease subunit
VVVINDATAKTYWPGDNPIGKQVLSLGLASPGLYGAVSYCVSQRTREIGIRMALGADRTAIFALVLGEGARLSLFGLLAGLFSGFAVTRLMANILFGVRPTDPLTYILVIVLLAGVSLLASYVPARRATRVDPMTGLRDD